MPTLRETILAAPYARHSALPEHVLADCVLVLRDGEPPALAVGAGHQSRADHYR